MGKAASFTNGHLRAWRPGIGNGPPRNRLATSDRQGASLNKDVLSARRPEAGAWVPTYGESSAPLKVEGPSSRDVRDCASARTAIARAMNCRRARRVPAEEQVRLAVGRRIGPRCLNQGDRKGYASLPSGVRRTLLDEYGG